MKRVDRALIHQARRARRYLPAPIQRSLARRRHLKHVQINQRHLTDPAYLGDPPAYEVTWITPEGLPLLPACGFAEAPLSAEEVELVSRWLGETNLDSDGMLDRRMDNHGDELGRVRAALRTRVRIAGLDPASNGSTAQGGRILFDARSLQSQAFGQRGIGRFALAALQGLRAAQPDSRIDLLVDPGLEELPAELAGSCRQIRWVDSNAADAYSYVLQPSPMTASPDPLLPALARAPKSTALVFDYIPLHYPTMYLRYAPLAAEYAACLDALRLYTDYLAISHLAAEETQERLGVDPSRVQVAWPTSVHEQAARAARMNTSAPTARGPIVILTGDEPRKNTFGALAAAGAATADAASREVVVIGMGGHATRVHHWSIAAMMRPGEARTAERLTDEEMHGLLSSASIALVASFDEGLSLPVIEALAAGIPVVASDIPSHRELIGSGSYLAPAGDLPALTAAVRSLRGSARVRDDQARELGKHVHRVLEDVIAEDVGELPAMLERSQEVQTKPHSRPRIAFLTPWNPQRTGVADFSTAVGRELAGMCDLTIVTTSGAEVDPELQTMSVDAVLADPAAFRSQFDAVLLVVGNSHFHLAFIEALAHLNPIVIAHDTRMVEFYMALRSQAGAAAVMTRGQVSKTLAPPLDEQIDDMRLLQNAGFWEIAHFAQALILHSTSAAPRIAAETGLTPVVLPFANQRVPDSPHISDADRAAARTRLGFDESQVHIATFGYIDPRTKLTDMVVEAAGWLQDWGHRIHLHIVGAGTPEQVQELTERAQELHLSGFTITGFAEEEMFCDYLLAVDCAVQLRVSPLLGVSGPLSDQAAFGTRAVASLGLCIDVDTPEYITAIPNDTSPVIVAEAVERLLQQPLDSQAREHMRRAYLAGKTPKGYAEELMRVITDLDEVDHQLGWPADA